MKCAVCGSLDVRPKLRKEAQEILECRACGLAFWVPSGDFRPESLYDSGYFASDAQRGYDDYALLEGSLRATFAQRIARLPGAAAGGRLLDVGAAYGFCVKEAQAAGWRAAGVEISRDAARQAQRESAGRVLVAHARELPFADQSFDVVTLWDVLEHLADPHRAIAEIARVLKKGGSLALTTGDVGSLLARVSGPLWHLYTLPEHLFFYTRESLRRLLAAHGLRVERIRAEGAVFTLGYLLERLRKTLLPARARQHGRSWPGQLWRVRVNLFDVLTVHAVLDPGNVGP